MYHLPPLPRRFSNFSSNLRSAENFPFEQIIKKKAPSKVISILFSSPVLYVQRFGIYQPYLILALDSPESSCARHDMGDVGPVDRMCQQIARTSARNVNERVERVRLPQGLNERRLDNRRDKGKSPAATIGVAAKSADMRERGIGRVSRHTRHCASLSLDMRQRRSRTRSAADGTGTPRTSRCLHALQIECSA